ncbi:hypothetical protein MACH09_20520 [Vibrio sp. MACH09]|nr:hypothetical protein MACH09_20520 [Vibrio sp. MACH09]
MGSMIMPSAANTNIGAPTAGKVLLDIDVNLFETGRENFII